MDHDVVTFKTCSQCSYTYPVNVGAEDRENCPLCFKRDTFDSVYLKNNRKVKNLRRLANIIVMCTAVFASMYLTWVNFVLISLIILSLTLCFWVYLVLEYWG